MLVSAALPDEAPHLLVVDDDRRIRALLSRFLFAEGYRVTTAETAADARAKGSSVFSAAWRQSLAWCSHNSTCDDIAPTSCGQLMQTRTPWRSLGWLCVANVHSPPGGRSMFKAAYMDCR